MLNYIERAGTKEARKDWTDLPSQRFSVTRAELWLKEGTGDLPVSSPLKLAQLLPENKAHVLNFKWDTAVALLDGGLVLHKEMILLWQIIQVLLNPHLDSVFSNQPDH